MRRQVLSAVILHDEKRECILHCIHLLDIDWQKCQGQKMDFDGW
jgi:hypothetical protein